MAWYPIIFSKPVWPSWKLCCHSVHSIPVNSHRFETSSTRSMFVGSCCWPGWLYSCHCALFVCLTCPLWILGHKMLLSLLHPVLGNPGTSSCPASFFSRTEFHVSPQESGGSCSSVFSGARASGIYRFTKEQQFSDGQCLKVLQYSLEMCPQHLGLSAPAEHGHFKASFHSVDPRVLPGIPQKALGEF